MITKKNKKLQMDMKGFIYPRTPNVCLSGERKKNELEKEKIKWRFCGEWGRRKTKRKAK